MDPRLRVLIVEDDDLMARSLARVLGDGHEVLVVSRAEEALAVLATGERFEIILCDLVMPGMTGVDFLMNLDPIAPEQSQRIVFLTAEPRHPMARLITSNRVLNKVTDCSRLPGLLAELAIA